MLVDSAISISPFLAIHLLKKLKFIPQLQAHKPMFLNNPKRFLSSTAIALIFALMPDSSKAVPVDLVDGTDYGIDNPDGFIKDGFSGGTTDVTFTAIEGEYFNIGADGVSSVRSETSDSSTLNIGVSNSGVPLDPDTTGVIFEDDIFAADYNTINLNVNDGAVFFKGNVGAAGNLVNITAGNATTGTNSELNFQILHDENLDIYASIVNQAEAASGSNKLYMTIKNNSGNDENFISFKSDIGGSDPENTNAFINLTIGDAFDGGAATNNVNFEGQYLNANSINIGVDGSVGQTHNLLFLNQNAEIRGDILGLVGDTITISQTDYEDYANTTFHNSVSNIDNIVASENGSMIFRGDVMNSSITLDGDYSAARFGNDDFITYVNSDIVVSDNLEDVIIDIGNWDDGGSGVNFSGSITTGNGSYSSVWVMFNSVIGHDGGGNITFADGNDSLSSNYGDNQFRSNVNFGDGDDSFYVSDGSAVLTGEMTNLESTYIYDAYLAVVNGGSYTGNVDGNSSGGLSIGASMGGFDETPITYNSPGTIDSVQLQVGGSATFNTNGHEFGSDTALDSIYVIQNATLNMQDNVTVSGITSMENNATIRIGAEATLRTAYQESDSGTLIFDVASPTSAGYLEVTDGAVNLTGLNVEANLTGSDSLFTNGNQIKVAQGDAALIGVNGEVGQESTSITENSALFSILMMDGSQLESSGDSSDLYLVFSQDSSIQQIANNPNNKNVGKVFDDLSGTSDTELSQIITRINAASQSELESILASTTTDVGGGIAVESQNFVNNTLDITSQQIDIAMNSHTGVASGDESNGLRMWGQSFFEEGRQGIRKGIAGYNSSTSGLAFGADTTNLLDNAVIGLGFSYGNNKVNSKNANNARNTIGSYQLTAYGSYSFPQNYFLKAMAAYSRNEVKTIRHNVGGLGLNATGDYNANVYTFRTDIGKDFYKVGNMRITPSFMAHYSRYNAENYSEKGAGGASLNVKSKLLEIFELGTNLELGWNFKLGKRTFAPEIRAGYRYNLIGNRFRTNSSFAGGGASFDTVGARPAKGALTFGGGLIYQVSDLWDVSLNYEYERRQNFHSNSGFVRGAYHF